MKSLLVALCLFVTASASAGCSSKSTENSTPSVTTEKSTMYTPPYTGAELDQLTAHPNRHLVIETNFGKITLQLFDKIAPNHVANIIKLANEGFYNGITFHRVIPGFMIQGGDPNSKDDDLSNDGTGGSPTKIKAEFSKFHHGRGILSAARTSDPNSATSQFFIMVDDAPFLDNQYTIYGQVIEGMDVADKIVALKRDANDNPGKASVMNKVYVTGS